MSLFSLTTFQSKYNTTASTLEAPDTIEISTMASADTGKIAFIPLEANPELMNSLLHRIGLKQDLAMHDVYSITEPELLAFIPRPAYALLLVFPVSAAYESFRLAEDATFTEYKGKGEGEPVVWFKQTIRNACGLMGLLHAVSNGPARKEVGEVIPFSCFTASAAGAIGASVDVLDLHYLTSRPTRRIRLRSRQASQTSRQPRPYTTLSAPRDITIPRARAPLCRQPRRHGCARCDR